VKIGFIGAGNMAEAIISGMMLKNTVEPENIMVFDIDKDKLNRLKECNNITLAVSNEEIIKNCDYVVLAVKPHIYEPLLKNLKDMIQEKKPVLISIAAGIKLSKMAEFLGDTTIPIIRVMPNVCVSVLEGMSAICGGETVLPKDLEVALNIFSSIGKTVEIEEKFFEVYAGIAGCSPAFTFMFIEGLAKAGLKNGLSKKDATKIAAQAVFGSAKMILEMGEHPISSVDKVTSPGGTTIAGVAKLEEKAFISTMIEAVEATMKRDRELQNS